MDILFDIGNVIIGVDFLPSLRSLLPIGLSEADSNQRLDRMIERKDEFEAGRIDEDSYFSWCAETIGFTGSREEFLRAWVSIFDPNMPMWDTIHRLHEEGHRLILFSNINNPHKDFLMEKYPIFSKFEGGVFSFETGHIKPEPEIYQLAIDQWNLDPANTIYIDDLAANIAAGEKAGLRCHMYSMDSHDQFSTWLTQQIS
ncbi:alpha-D-glucose 1-phosphate phosphatase YihX [Oceaniferula spumae]|uniref:Alpha-D-glucose 1-phosphate phosphatase YihX n=1 Tax=Oceaniferula spumae TaxID=2979115 RepID=A0AAT9FS79_9BACT